MILYITAGPKLEEIFESLKTNTPVYFRIRRKGGGEQAVDVDLHVHGISMANSWSTEGVPDAFILKLGERDGYHNFFSADYKPRTGRGSIIQPGQIPITAFE